MKRVTLLFLSLALVALFFADLEIVSLNPIFELKRLFRGIITPDFSMLFSLKQVVLNTITFAFLGITIAIFIGALLAPLYRLKIVRYFATTIRSIHEIFWAFLFLPIFGLTATTGVLAIAVPYIGIFAKRFAEIYQEADLRPYHALSKEGSFLSRFFFGLFPLIFDEMAHYSLYRFECALRSSAVLGFIGLPTIGFHLESYFSEGMYSQAAALLILFYLLIFSLKYWVKKRFIPFYIIGSFLLISKDVHFRVENVVRFLTRDIVPWPIRREGVISGSGELSLNWEATQLWFQKIFTEEVIPGVINTVVLTQLALVLTGAVTLILIIVSSRHLVPKIVRWITNFILVILRTTPDYIIAFVAIQIWGPSMFPGLIALVIHNGAVVTFLTLKNVDKLELPIDSPKGKVNRYFYVILPRIYGNFLSNLFYRWEVMIRESSLLGILGIYTLGFYVDSGIADAKMDKALVLILFIALLNIIVDSISQRVREYVRSQ